MKKFYLLLPILLIFACAPTRYVKPLEKGQLAVGADFGGPLIVFSGMTIPLPLTNVNAGYGLSENTTLFGGLHTTALAFGVLQLDAGAVHAFSQSQGLRPGISSSASLNFMLGLEGGGSRIFPQLDLNAFWEYHSGRKLIYAGISNWFELKKYRAHGEEQPVHWLPSLQIGHTFVREKWDFTLEIKQVAFNQEKGV